MYLFQGLTADEVWLQAAAVLADPHVSHPQQSRVGPTREILSAAFTIKNPRQRWVLSRIPALNPAFALAEVIWIVCGRQDARFINYWNPKLPQFAGKAKRYHGAYGHRLRRHFRVDQLTRAYQALSSNPESRQVVLQIWDPLFDLPTSDGRPSDPDIPCNICSFAKIRDNKLEWTQVLRSNDLFLGVPHNFVQFTAMQEILAAWLGVELGFYRHLSDCLHVYDRDLPHLSDLSEVSAEPNTDVLQFTKAEGDVLFAELSSKMDQMTQSFLSQRKLRRLVRCNNLSKALNNWLLLVAADCARRRRWVDLSYELMAECSNPLLRQLWDRWLARWWKVREEEPISSEAIIYAQPALPLEFA